MAVLRAGRGVLIDDRCVLPPLCGLKEPRFPFARQRMALSRVQYFERALGVSQALKQACGVERKSATLQIVVEGRFERCERLEGENGFTPGVRGAQNLSC